jgi:hypothetical protein
MSKESPPGPMTILVEKRGLLREKQLNHGQNRKRREI